MTSLFRHAKTGMYWVRRKVPKDLRPIVGKGEIQRTTGTKDLAAAKVRAKPIGIEIDQIFADARAGKFRKFSDSELTTFAMAWIGDLIRQLEHVRDIAGQRMVLGIPNDPNDFDPLGRARPIQDEAELDAALVEWTTSRELALSAPDFDRLRELAFEEHTNSFPPGPVLSQIRGAAPMVQPNGMTVRQLYEAYGTEAKLTEKAQAEWKSVLRRLTDHVGDGSVRAITKDQMVEFKDLLIRTPKRIPPKHRKLQLPKLVEAIQDDQTIERLSATSVNKTMQFVAALFACAARTQLRGRAGRRYRPRLPETLQFSAQLGFSPLHPAGTQRHNTTHF